MNVSARLFARARGCTIWSADGREITDFLCAGGDILLGHADPDVLEALSDAASRGLVRGMRSETELLLQKILVDTVPLLEEAVLCESGSEAVTEALRIAESFTKRRGVVRFGEGTTLQGISGPVHALPWGDRAALGKFFRKKGSVVAAVLAAPVSPDRGFLPPPAGFLKLLRDLCDEAGALLIFDERLSAFRYGFSAFASFCGIRPDLFCFGGLIGGGLSLGAVGGRRKLLELRPEGRGACPIAAAAGLAALVKIEKIDPFGRLDDFVRRIRAELNAFADENGFEFHVLGEAGMFTPYFCPGAGGAAGLKGCDISRYGMFSERMLDRGFYLPRSQYSPAFITLAHDDSAIDLFIEAAKESLEETFETQ
jgi:glutamate-1-semialdehyde 2,1-aminomutase